MATGVMAQAEKACPNAACDSQKVKITPEQKAKQITARMAKTYDLTAEQEEKLLALNLSMLKRHRPAQKCPKSNGQCMESAQKCPKADGQCAKAEGKCPKAEGQCSKADGKCPKAEGKCPKIEGQCPKAKGQCAEGAEKCFENKGACQKNDSAQCKAQRRPRQGKAMRGMYYFKALKAILTPEQFKAYCMDKAIERQMLGLQQRPGVRAQGHGPQMKRRGVEMRMGAQGARAHGKNMRHHRYHARNNHHEMAPAPAMRHRGQQMYWHQPQPCSAAQPDCTCKKSKCKGDGKKACKKSCKKCKKQKENSNDYR